MFKTVDTAEIPVPKIFGNDHERMWSYVTFKLHIPWFYVVCTIQVGEEGTLTYMFCLTHVEHLLQLAGAEEFKIEEVNLIIPKWMSGKGHWTMELLNEIWEATEPDAKSQPAYIFVTVDKTRYVDSALSTSETDLCDSRLVYRASVHT